MAVINNAAPAPAAQTSDNGMGFLLGIILLIVFAFAIFYYGIPALRGSMGGAATTPSVNVPGKIDVNVNHK